MRTARVRGFSIIEMVFALCLIVVGFFTFFSVFSTGSHHAIQTQNRAAANMLAQSYLEDFRAHAFGQPAPPSWGEDTERPVRMVIKDRETAFVFHKKISYETGAFVGTAEGDRDKVTLVITWKEGVGLGQTGGPSASSTAAPSGNGGGGGGNFCNPSNPSPPVFNSGGGGGGGGQTPGELTGFPDDNKMIQVEMPVWR